MFLNLSPSEVAALQRGTEEQKPKHREPLACKKKKNRRTKREMYSKQRSLRLCGKDEPPIGKFTRSTGSMASCHLGTGSEQCLQSARSCRVCWQEYGDSFLFVFFFLPKWQKLINILTAMWRTSLEE